ncbi:unnamed protein product [Closterium sp. NIES-64]|nr:unnamed protein product [Closterium sp. NIES-64]
MAVLLSSLLPPSALRNLLSPLPPLAPLRSLASASSSPSPLRLGSPRADLPLRVVPLGFGLDSFPLLPSLLPLSSLSLSSLSLSLLSLSSLSLSSLSLSLLSLSSLSLSLLSLSSLSLSLLSPMAGLVLTEMICRSVSLGFGGDFFPFAIMNMEVCGWIWRCVDGYGGVWMDMEYLPFPPLSPPPYLQENGILRPPIVNIVALTATIMLPGHYYSAVTFIAIYSIGVKGVVVGLMAVAVPTFLSAFSLLPLWDSLQRDQGLGAAVAGAGLAGAGVEIAVLLHLLLQVATTTGPLAVGILTASLVAAFQTPAPIAVATGSAFGLILYLVGASPHPIVLLLTPSCFSSPHRSPHPIVLLLTPSCFSSPHRASPHPIVLLLTPSCFSSPHRASPHPIVLLLTPSCFSSPHRAFPHPIVLFLVSICPPFQYKHSFTS